MLKIPPFLKQQLQRYTVAAPERGDALGKKSIGHDVRAIRTRHEGVRTRTGASGRLLRGVTVGVEERVALGVRNHCESWKETRQVLLRAGLLKCPGKPGWWAAPGPFLQRNQIHRGNRRAKGHGVFILSPDVLCVT